MCILIAEARVKHLASAAFLWRDCAFSEEKRTKTTKIGGKGRAEIGELHLLESIAKDFDYKTSGFAAKKCLKSVISISELGCAKAQKSCAKIGVRLQDTVHANFSAYMRDEN